MDPSNTLRPALKTSLIRILYRATFFDIEKSNFHISEFPKHIIVSGETAKYSPKEIGIVWCCYCKICIYLLKYVIQLSMKIFNHCSYLCIIKHILEESRI